jgi:ATP adenylyltransferase
VSGLERLWATWRQEYITGLTTDTSRPIDGCVLCGVLDLRHEHAEQLVHAGEHAAVILNAYPYTSGHVMVLPYQHRARLTDLDSDVRTELFDLTHRAVAAIERAYSPHGVNFGANLGRGSGAGIPDHLHVHVLPRWEGDTNFMTTVAETRVMPEDLDTTLSRLRDAFE